MPGKKLLVADDSLTIQKVIRLALSNEGYEIQATSDGNDALQQLSLFRPDIVLVDISLPGKSAFDLKREVNQSEGLRGVRFVLMSSAFERIDENLVNEVGFHGRLTKPFDPANLRQVLAEVLAQASASPPAPPAPSVAPPAPPKLASVKAPPPPPKPASAMPPHPPSIQPPPPIFDPPSLNPQPPPMNLQPPPLNLQPPISITKGIEMPEPTLSGIPPLPTDGVWATGQDDPESPSENLMERTMETIVPPPSSEPSLFGFDLPTQTVPLEPPRPAGAGRSDDDIRELTESTIRMSGLDEFQWGVKEPALKPLPGMADSGSSTFELTGTEDGFESQIKPFSVDLSPEAAGIAPPHAERSAERSAEHAPATYGGGAPAGGERSHGSMPLQPELEEVIRAQVKETLEKMAAKILPEVAEKVIKQEIHRLLSELP